MSDQVNIGGGEKIGLKTAVAEALQANGGALPPEFVAAEQLEMLPLRKAEAGPEAVLRLSSGGGVGRPPGAKNRRTQEMADYILSKYTSPLIALAETYSRPVQDLAKELSCSLLEAYKLQQNAAEGLAPYIHQKMPTAIETGEGGLIGLTINIGQHAQEAAASEGFNLEIIDLPSEKQGQQNQLVSGQSAQKSNGGKSNECEEVQLNPSETTGKAAD